MKCKNIFIPVQNVFVIKNELYYHLLQYVVEIFVLKMVFLDFEKEDNKDWPCKNSSGPQIRYFKLSYHD